MELQATRRAGCVSTLVNVTPLDILQATRRQLLPSFVVTKKIYLDKNSGNLQLWGVFFFCHNHSRYLQPKRDVFFTITKWFFCA